MNRILLCMLACMLVVPLYSQWESMQGPEGGSVNSIYQNSSYYFVSTPHGMYRSASGDQWEQIKLDLPKKYSLDLVSITDSLLYVSMEAYSHQTDSSLLFRSSDQGKTWVQLDPPNLYSARGLYAINRTVMFFGRSKSYTGPDSLWLSHDAGETWQLSTLTPVAEYFYGVYGSQESVIITAIGSKEFRFYPETDTWADAGMPDSLHFENIFEFDSIWFAFTSVSGLMYRSVDDGHSWMKVSPKNWESGYPKMSETSNAMYISASNVLYKSTDRGLTWHFTSITDISCYAIYPAENGLFMATSTGLFHVAEPDLTITPSYSGIVASRVKPLHLKENQLWFASTGISRFNTTTESFDLDLYVGGEIDDIATLDGKVFALKEGQSVIRSNDNGATWKSASPLDFYPRFLQLFTDNHTLYLGGADSFGPSYTEPLFTEDYGVHWDPFTINSWPVAQPYLIARKDNLLFVASNHTIYRSGQNDSWQSIDMDSYSSGDIIQLYASDHFLLVIFYDSYNYLTFISSDDGDHWREITSSPTYYSLHRGFNEFLIVGDNIIGLNSRTLSDVLLSTDLGETWNLFDQGLYSNYVSGLQADDQYIYVGTSGQGLWRRKISDLQSVNTSYQELKSEVTLFPNPSTGLFSFISDISLPEKARLSITDINGKVVWTSIQLISPGMNTIDYSLKASGTYLFSISTDTVIKTGKIIFN